MHKALIPPKPSRGGLCAAAAAVLLLVGGPALAADPAAEPAASVRGSKPNILYIVSDDHGWGDSGPYLGGEARGMPSPNFDRLAEEGMMFTNFYGQPSCTPSRAAMHTGRYPNRSGITTVAFQGQGGGLPAAEWTIASVLKEAGYNTYFTGKWHLGEGAESLPIAHGYDTMENVFLYHLNAYTYTDPNWFPDMPQDMRDMYNEVTTGSLFGKAGEKAQEAWKVDGSYNDTPEKGVVGIPFLDAYVEQTAIKYLEEAAQNPDTPFLISVAFMKMHQPNLPHPDFKGASISKSKYADSHMELDARVGNLLNKLDELGLAENTVVFYTTDNGAWQDVYPDAGYTPFRGTKGTVREGGNRVPAFVRWPGKVPANSKSAAIVGGVDLMATFANLAGLDLPTEDREGQPIIFDSIDMTPVWTDTGEPERTAWFYFTENELTPGAARVGPYKAVFNLRGDNGAHTGGLAVDSNLGWKGPEKYAAAVPQVFNLLDDPQERYDLFMNNFTERTWFLPAINDQVKELMKTYVQYPPRKPQSEVYSGPITLSQYQRFKHVRDALEKEGISLPMPTGN